MKAGRRLEEVQEILGHESIATTRIYAHLEPERLKAAAACLPDISRPGRKIQNPVKLFYGVYRQALKQL